MYSGLLYVIMLFIILENVCYNKKGSELIGCKIVYIMILDMLNNKKKLEGVEMILKYIYSRFFEWWSYE